MTDSVAQRTIQTDFSLLKFHVTETSSIDGKNTEVPVTGPVLTEQIRLKSDLCFSCFGKSKHHVLLAATEHVNRQFIVKQEVVLVFVAVHRVLIRRCSLAPFGPDWFVLENTREQLQFRRCFMLQGSVQTCPTTTMSFLRGSVQPSWFWLKVRFLF
ncbi:hypothetical protein GOODEAATRI_025228 [Goodea atripinnis]|uniref:Uncharacterized protein n=1 Tax=Goodea atripinnis TaxID=208336 RepID=A0ABV0NDI7_9TELE